MFYVIFFILTFSVQAQEKNTKPDVYTELDEKPEFKGGQEALIKFMQANINYPEEAKKSGSQGKVFVSFVIDENGTVKDSRIARGVNPALDKEALRVVKLMPEWTPGKKDGKSVQVEMMIPVMFALDHEKKPEKN